MPVIIARSYEKIGAYLAELGEFMTDIPFVVYHNMDMQNLDVEIAFPVAQKFADQAEIKANIIPKQKVVFCVFMGGYIELELVYAEMAKWILDHGYRASGVSYEYYFSDPECSDQDKLIKIVLPLIF